MDSSYENFLDFYRRGPYAPCLKEYRLAGASPVRLTMSSQPAGHYPDPPFPDLVIGQIVSGRGLCGTDVGAGRWRGLAGVGDMALAPPRSATDFSQERPFEFLHVAVPFAALRSLFDEELVPQAMRSGDFGRLHAAPFRDPFLTMLCGRLWREAADDNPFGRLFVDSALGALAATLARLAGQDARGPARRGGLSARQIRRVDDYIHAELARDLSLDDLARVACLSPPHFARAFKQATGVAPYKHVLRLRVERAQSLLVATDAPIAEIALDCGFCHQEHLTTVFRRVTGATPGAYRKSSRN